MPASVATSRTPTIGRLSFTSIRAWVSAAVISARPRLARGVGVGAPLTPLPPRGGVGQLPFDELLLTCGELRAQ